MLAIEVAKDEFSVHTIDDDNRQYDHYTGKLLDRDKYIAERKKELDQVEAYCVIRRVEKSEAIDGTHVRIKEIGKLRYGFEEFVHRKVDKVIEEIEQVKLMEKRDDTSHQRQIDHVVTGMDELIYAHPRREAEPDCAVVWLLLKAHAGARKAARLWQEWFRNGVFVKAGWKAVAVEPNVHHKVENLNDDDDASTCVHGDDIMVKSRIDVIQDAKAMSEHKVDIEVLAIIGPGQNIKGQDRETSPVLETRWDHAGQIGAVVLTPGTAVGRTNLETCKSSIIRLEALQPISYSTGWTLPLTSAV